MSEKAEAGIGGFACLFLFFIMLTTCDMENHLEKMADKCALPAASGAVP